MGFSCDYLEKLLQILFFLALSLFVTSVYLLCNRKQNIQNINYNTKERNRLCLEVLHNSFATIADTSLLVQIWSGCVQYIRLL